MYCPFDIIQQSINDKKHLKIPKGYSEAINLKTKGEKGQTMIYKTLHRKQKIEPYT